MENETSYGGINGRDDRPSGNAPDAFDRLLGALDGLPGVTSTTPTTIDMVQPVVGHNTTYVVRTFRQQFQTEPDDAHKRRTWFEDTLFIKFIEGTRVVRLPLPEKVITAAIRQRESLTSRARKKLAKAAAADRRKRGIVPNTEGLERHRKAKRGRHAKR
jgi:hypothetical protein